jgi:hypothetical protein
VPTVPLRSTLRSTLGFTLRTSLRRCALLALAVLCLVTGLAGPAAAGPSDVRRYAVTAAQERVVLRLVDDICGDTWCEGDHAFRFQRFDCHPRRGCVLRVQLASWSHEPLRWSNRSARIVGFRRFADMVRTAPDGSRSLQPAFYEAVGDAVRTMTATVPVR